MTIRLFKYNCLKSSLFALKNTLQFDHLYNHKPTKRWRQYPSVVEFPSKLLTKNGNKTISNYT